MFKKIPTVSILGLDFVDLSLPDFVSKIVNEVQTDKSITIFTPNPEMFVEANQNKDFYKVLQQADYLTVDGVGIQLWFKQAKYRITGVDLSSTLLKNTELKFFLLGGQKGAADIVKNKYTNVVGVFDDYVSLDDSEQIIKKIKSSQANVVLVGLGAVKQENWIVKYKDSLPSVKLWLGIGGTIDFLADKQKRSPLILQKLGLEWLWRLIQEPSRFKRIWNAVVVFSWISFKSKFK